ncbi:LysR family transcriptional regulator [Polaromonas glacialis]|uniref:LysR family transcriptional regulator n=1 Tax=Polaromonas glacialis TaxID=866564 RepID=UPI00068D5B8E|nr:LysR family transcriptional regulator [Polaromonas glacialis]
MTAPRPKFKIRQMELLMALDGTRNLHRAAQATSMSQPAASKMLKDMEESFGVAFFERLPRGMQPTACGETLVRHVRMALDKLSQGENAITALQAGLSGQADVGVIITASMTLVPRAIASAKSEAPQLTIGVDVGTSAVLMERFKKGQLDFLIARIQTQEDQLSLRYEDLSKETDCAVARIGHPLLQRPDISLRELACAGWILSPRGSILRHQFDMVFHRSRLEAPTNVVETTAMSVIKSLLQQTDFLHVMPMEIAQYYVESGELAILPFDLRCSMDNFGIITRADHELSPGAQLLLRHIRQVAGTIYPGFLAGTTADA